MKEEKEEQKEKKTVDPVPSFLPSFLLLLSYYYFPMFANLSLSMFLASFSIGLLVWGLLSLLFSRTKANSAVTPVPPVSLITLFSGNKGVFEEGRRESDEFGRLTSNGKATCEATAAADGDSCQIHGTEELSLLKKEEEGEEKEEEESAVVESPDSRFQSCVKASTLPSGQCLLLLSLLDTLTFPFLCSLGISEDFVFH